MAMACQILRYVLGFLFLFAGLAKLRSRSRFEHAVAEYQLLPLRTVPIVAKFVPVIEVGGAIALLLGVWPAIPAFTFGVLLLIFASAAAVNLARHRYVDCGCFGARKSEPISWALVARNAVLAGGAALVAVVDPSGLVLVTTDANRAVAVPDALAALLIAATIVIATALVRACQHADLAARKALSSLEVIV
jgi:uncharacterized membrane protein YphA (DoxX/SURF4 family)